MTSIYNKFGISNEIYEKARKAEESLKQQFEKIDAIAEHNQLKVIGAMQDSRLAAEHFATSTGYGYNDMGRDTLEEVYAKVFGTEAALVRPQITCGTHALATALSANLLPGDEVLSPVGRPYDTLEKVIGIKETPCSLAEYGVTYKEVALTDEGFDFEGIRKAITEKTKLATIQRSRGYSLRRTLSPEQIGELVSFIKSINPNIICMVDNCYGEFTQTKEPSDYGADMVVGSLIKNPGGGLASSGGYICGKKEYVERCGYRLNAPGLGHEVGANFGILGQLFQGLFLAPSVTAAALKGALFASALFEAEGLETFPRSTEDRYDIVQAINLGNRENVIAFCTGIQKAAPVDSFVSPIPAPMPGYENEVIMAAGAFVQGSSIELSADAPMRDPYTVFFQGGLTWQHAKFGILNAYNCFKEHNK